MDEIGKALLAYAKDASTLAGAPGSTEPTFYPAIHRLLSTVLTARNLPFEVRANTSQHRSAGGVDLPDLAFYDGAGDYVVVLGEVKVPAVDIDELARSTERNDQIGRYLASAGVVLLTNVRSFGLLSVGPSYQGQGAVPPNQRHLLEVVDLWSSVRSLKAGRPPELDSALALADLIDTAVTEFAPIAEPESLARILARQAKQAKAGLPSTFSSAVRPLLDDFSEALGLTFEGEEGEEFLRSSLIQTAFYGLFASWTLWRHSGSKRDFEWRDLGEYLKIPFLGALFHEFRNPVRLRELGLAAHMDRATAALHRVDVERFFSRFSIPHVVEAASAPESSATHAILYFYEPFLEAFDPELRKELGVWYTPQEIVRYQVRKVDRLLREELDCPRGFADDRVVVLDPCCGTGAYLIEVLRCVAEQLQEEGLGAAVANKLLHAFCHRIIGFEILTAPFVVAQLQLYLILSEMGVEPDEEHRPAIFLTNALTGWDGPEQLKLQFPELQQEHEAARRVKREATIIVILGNPPYNRFVGAPVEEEQELADHYKGIRRDEAGRQVGNTELYQRFGVRKHLLDDIYLRFFRLAEIRIGEVAEHGVVSWISNSSYLTGRSHPLMRESLLRSFDEIWIDNLNGDKYRTGKIIPAGLPGAGSSDQRVFTTEQDPRGIQVGISISTFLKRPPSVDKSPVAEVHYRDFWGMSVEKRQALVKSLHLIVHPEEISLLARQPSGPREYERVEPTERSGWRLVPTWTSGGYEDWPALDEIFPTRFQGVNPNRGLDGSIVATVRQELADRMSDYFSDLPHDELRELYPELMQRRARYDPETVRESILGSFRADRVVPYEVFPLDLRYIYYESESKLLNERRPELWDNLPGNRFLITVPHARRRSEARPLPASCLFDLHLHDRGSVGIPVQVRSPDAPRDLFADQRPAAGPVANLQQNVWRKLSTEWSLAGDLHQEDAKGLVGGLIDFCLALSHAPQYQLDHQDSLAQDWLRLPIPKEPDLFRRIAELGEVVRVLLDPLAEVTSTLQGVLGSARGSVAVPSSVQKAALRDGDLIVTISHFGAARGGWRERAVRQTDASYPAWGETTGDLFLNDSAYLANVPERVWRYELGGYPVIKKWLGYRDQKRRPGRPLSGDELDHLRSMIHRIAAVLLLHQNLDEAYEKAIQDPFTIDDLGL